MPETIEGNGQCACGAVTFVAKTLNPIVGACHCKMCRQWGGGPFMEVECGTEVFFTGEEHISIFNSSDWAERGFCKKCGSHLFYRFKEANLHMMPVGLFEDDSQFVFKKQVFIEEKPSYYHFANKTEDMTGDELVAQFSGASD
ncbi:MAG: GFA family protein [Gammaproteobacteria bacterium]|jgi:hypothetical protein